MSNKIQIIRHNYKEKIGIELSAIKIDTKYFIFHPELQNIGHNTIYISKVSIEAQLHREIDIMNNNDIHDICNVLYAPFSEYLRYDIVEQSNDDRGTFIAI